MQSLCYTHTQKCIFSSNYLVWLLSFTLDTTFLHAVGKGTVTYKTDKVNRHHIFKLSLFLMDFYDVFLKISVKGFIFEIPIILYQTSSY